jgi:hypothetical protein
MNGLNKVNPEQSEFLLSTGEPSLIRCADCTQVPCVLSCDSNAIAYVCGDLLIEIDKCAVCGQYKGSRIPDCVISCGHSREKTVLETLSTGMKQIRAANALSLLKL